MLSNFLSDVLPSDGRYALWTAHNKNHIWVDGLGELVNEITRRDEMQGVFFATAGFGDELAIDRKTGQLKVPHTFARTQANVLARRAYHLDLDAGEEKLEKHGEDAVYATQRDALVGLVAFAKKTVLPPTYIISSGEGLHAYWCLDDDIDVDQWALTAEAFSRLFAQEGLKQDFACTTDSARVLRPIGTLHKNGTRVSVIRNTGRFYSQDELHSSIVGQLDEPVLPKKSKAASRTSINDDVLSVQGPPKSIVKVLKRCSALLKVAKRQGNVEEPLWRAMLGVVKHTVEGAPAAHKLSQGHPDYDYDDTQDKFDRWATGPATCDEFAKYCSKECGACEHRGQIKSPISLGNMTVEQVEKLPEEKKPVAPTQQPTGMPWDGFIPKGFSVKKITDGHLLTWQMPVDRETDDGVERIIVDVPVTTDIFWFSQWADSDNTDDNAQTVIVKWDGSIVRNYTFDQTLIANQQKFREFLAGKSIFTSTHKKANTAMEEYTKAQMMRIRTVGQLPKITGRFGLRIQPDGELICAQGQYVIRANGEIQEAMLGPELRSIAADFYLPLPPSNTKTWGTDVWDAHLMPAAKQHAKFLRDHYRRTGLEKYQLACMFGLSSPLMAFVTGEYRSGVTLPPNGLTVSLYSREGGRGKTTLMRAMALAFGRPEATVRGANQMGSTDKGRIERLTLMGTMPSGQDEMGTVGPKATTELIYAIANGASRERAKQTGGLITAQTWALTALMSSNKSQRDLLSLGSPESTAVQFRMLELDVDYVTEFSPEEQAQFTEDWSALAPCAGALGAVIHRAICRLGIEKINTLVMQCVNKAAQRVNAGQTERFQYRGLGAVIALHLLLKQEGIEMFDVDTLIDEFKLAQESAKAFVAENAVPTDGLMLMSMFLHDMHDQTVVTQTETRRTKHITKFDMPVNGKVPPVVSVRHVIEHRRSYVSMEALRKWCADKSVPMNKMLYDCRKEDVLSSVYASRKPGTSSMFNLLKGMQESSGASTNCLVVDMFMLAKATSKDYSRELQAITGETVDNVVPFKHEGAAEGTEVEPTDDVEVA